ncbi:response regulator transcription factor [Salinibaculum salinum]|uniref:response regulator transcription factor n=1 Tax=Salinibaculum salinum TaxID=3131996 RepID=UPI0030ED8C56
MATQEISADATDTGDQETTVLFVDDEPDLLEVYELLCESEYNVLTAEGGEEALETFGEHIDFAFFDRRMPKMTGDEVIETLRDEGYETPMGIISAVDPEEEPSAGYASYLTKPIDTDDIQDTVSKHTP